MAAFQMLRNSDKQCHQGPYLHGANILVELENKQAKMIEMIYFMGSWFVVLDFQIKSQTQES